MPVPVRQRRRRPPRGVGRDARRRRGATRRTTTTRCRSRLDERVLRSCSGARRACCGSPRAPRPTASRSPRCAAARRRGLPPRGAYRGRRGRRAGFYLHGAKLMLAEGDGAKLTPDAIARGDRSDPRRRPPGPAARVSAHPGERIRPRLHARRARRARRAGARARARLARRRRAVRQCGRVPRLRAGGGRRAVSTRSASAASRTAA